MQLSQNDFILFTGDSVTDCGRQRPVGQGELFDALGNGYVRLINTLVQAFVPQLNLRIENTGFSGNNILQLKERWQSDVADLHPDWISVLIGINDVYSQFHSPFIPEWHVSLETYSNTLDQLVSSTEKSVKGIFLMSPFIIDPNVNDEVRKMLALYNAEIKNTAKHHNCIYIDLQKAFDEYCENRHCSFLTLDKIHPNMIGSMLIAREFLKAAGIEINIKY